MCQMRNKCVHASLKNMKYMFLNEFIRNAGYSLSSLMLSAATNIPSVNG